jgi:transposase
LGLSVYLRQYQLLPYARIRETLLDLFGAGPAASTLMTASLTCAAVLVPVEAAIMVALRAAPVGHADETSIKVAGQRQWVHVVSTAQLTHYARHAKRGHAATAAIGILPGFTGRLIHDGWASYWHHPGAHGLCNAHHLRELTAVAEQPGQPWAAGLRTLLRAVRRHVRQGRAAGRVASPPDECATFVARYRDLLAEGYAANPPPARTPDGPRRGRLKQSTARNLLDRLAAHEDAVLACLHDWTVPFDNNQAERDLRMIKVQQKVSGTFRDVAGADAFCRIRGYVATLRKQARQVLTALELTCLGQPPLPCLVPV